MAVPEECDVMNLAKQAVLDLLRCQSHRLRFRKIQPVIVGDAGILHISKRHDRRPPLDTCTVRTLCPADIVTLHLHGRSHGLLSTRADGDGQTDRGNPGCPHCPSSRFSDAFAADTLHDHRTTLKVLSPLALIRSRTSRGKIMHPSELLFGG